MLLLSPFAGAVGLGPIEVRSGLGQVLDARVALAPEPGKAIHAACFSLMPGARDDALPTLTRGTVALERSAAGAALRIRSPVPISEPAFSLRIRAACRGQPDQDERQYVVLLDPRPDSEGVQALPVIGATLVAGPGDTLESIAGRMFPSEPTARSQYLAALREANPAWAKGGPSSPQGMAIALPDLRAYARGRVPSASTSLPPATRAAMPRVAAADASKAAEAPRFVLKLSTAEMDLAPMRGMDERTRARLRERRLLLDADDNVAALLSLRNSVRHLESRIAELQLKLSAVPPSLATAKPQPAQAIPTTKVESAPAPVSATLASPPWQQFVRAPWTWAILAALAAVALLAVWRRRFGAAAQDDTPSAMLPTPPAAPISSGAERDETHRAVRAMATDAALSNRLPANSSELRRRYIEERFPEIGNRTLVLDDPSSIVKAARLFYEDGAVTPAVELLQFSIEEDPARPRTWLALFEIYRRERFADEYAALARRFREHHGDSADWLKVRYFGRDIDPANPLYSETDGGETDTPKQARRIAPAATFDPVAENWLDAPMDFEHEVLANELRQAAMAQASLNEQDLAANPLPALRNIEMFRPA